MSNCSACKKKFGFLKYNKTKCMECGQGYCLQCIRKANGLRLYCDICLILNTRPANRTRIMDVRSKEVKLYLARRKISTEHCLEKEDLVNQFLRYVDVEHSLPRNGNKKGLNFNGLMSSFTNSMPNLVETNLRRSNNATQESRNGEASSSNRTSFQVNDGPTSSNSSSSSSSHNVEQKRNNSENTTVTHRKLIRLSDIQNAEDISNLTVKQLKELLFINRIDFKGCVEKEELVKKALDLWIESRSTETESLPSEDLCKICMDAPLNSVFLECGHIATCIECGKQLAECPICRQYIVRVVHTFKA